MSRTIAKSLNDITQWFINNKHETLSFDTETNGLKWDQLQMTSICFHNGQDSIFIGETELFEPLQYQLLKVKELIAHNIVFDLKVLYNNLKFPLEFVKNLDDIKLYDTLTAQHLINENQESLSLKELAKTLLGEKDVKTWEEASKFKKYSKEWLDYCFKDVEYCWRLYELQKPLLIREGVDKLFYKVEMEFVKSLLDMAINGILLDKKRMDSILIELKKEQIDLTKQMLFELKLPYQVQQTLDGETVIKSPINFNSSQQLAKILFEDLGLDIVEETEGGKPSVGVITIDKYKDSNKFVGLLGKYKTVSKLISGFFESIPEHICLDGRVRSDFNNNGTVTGRLSSSNPNVQQLPKVKKDSKVNVRDCFIAEPGHKIFTADFSGQEIRMMCHLSNDPTLVDSLLKGKDIHLAVANQFYQLGIPEEGLFENNKEYKTYKNKFKEERDKAKIITFGLSYGKGAYGFAKDFNIPETEAQIIVDKYFANMPMLKKAIDNTHIELKAKGFVRSITGRKRRFVKVTKNGWTGYLRHYFRQSFNFKIQSASADMIRMAMIKVRKESNINPKYGIKILATVHDEVVVSGKEEYEKEIKELLKESFETAMKLNIPTPADIGSGYSYGEAK